MENECIHCEFKNNAAKCIDECGLIKLSENHSSANFDKGQMIIKQGMYSTHIVYLKSGLAKIHMMGPSSENIIRIVKGPTYLGNSAILDQTKHQYSITAISSSTVCFIEMSTFKELIKSNTIFAYELISELCKSELESYNRCINRSQKQSRGNLADVLLDFSIRIFESEKFSLPLSQSELGSMINSSRESISRILSEFAKDGIITLDGKKIEIINKKSLELISHNG